MINLALAGQGQASRRCRASPPGSRCAEDAGGDLPLADADAPRPGEAARLRRQPGRQHHLLLHGGHERASSNYRVSGGSARARSRWSTAA
ncbi:MAG: hypothetical protein MZW92_28850 [Comamonadaceae bacterium]|nr:hypothetical protein [Comamonadaceae bacterium]